MKAKDIIFYGFFAVMVALVFASCNPDPEPKPTHTHDYGTVWKSNATQHWHECSCGDKKDIANHTSGDWIVDQAATETTAGSKHKVCTVCEYETRETIPATGEGHIHDYGTEWKSNATQHWRECSCGDKSDVTNHTGDPCTVCGYASGNTEPVHVHQWGAWNVTLAANCTTAGSQTRTCALDATHTETEVIPINDDHDWGEWTGTVTCTEAGTGTRVCSRSAEHIETNDNLPPLGHDYQNYTQTTAPTCTTAGVETGTCTHDNSHTTTRPKAIDPTAHYWNTWEETTNPTCEIAGEETRTCIHNITHKEIRTGTAALGHDRQWSVIITATATANGLEGDKCQREGCNYYDLTTTREMLATSYFELITDDTDNSYFKAVGTYRIIKSDVVPPDVVYIPSYYNNVEVTEISLTSFIWGNGAFDSRSNIVEVNIPATVTAVNYMSFKSCINLETVNIEQNSNLKYIGYGSFSDCSNLKNMTIPEGLTTVSAESFSRCGFTSLTIPSSLTNISEASFHGCPNLTSIIVDSNNPSYSSENGMLFDKNKTILLQVPGGLTGIVNIPNGVINISNRALYFCENITEVIIPDSVTTIGELSFSGTNLESIIIPSGVISIGASSSGYGFAFSSWTDIQTIYLKGFASKAEADAVWGVNWLYNSNVIVKYWNGSEYQ